MFTLSIICISERALSVIADRSQETKQSYWLTKQQTLQQQ